MGSQIAPCLISKCGRWASVIYMQIRISMAARRKECVIHLIKRGFSAQGRHIKWLESTACFISQITS